MRRRTRSPKGSGGAAGGTTRGGRGRGRARGSGAKGKTGGRGGGAGNKQPSRSSSPADNDCVNIIVNSSSKDNHSSGHFSRQPNGLSGLQLRGIPRRPAYSSASSSNNNNNSNNAVNLNNGGPPPPPGSDYYLHKKFKKVTATVDPSPSASSSEPTPSSSSSCSNTASAASGMVYKPKFRIKSDLEASSSATTEDSTKIASTNVPAGPLPEMCEGAAVNLSVKPASTIMPVVPAPLQQRVLVQNSDLLIRTASSVMSTNSHSILIGGAGPRIPPASPSPTIVSSNGAYGHFPSSISPNSHSEPGKLSKEMRLDRKSMEDRIAKIIDENQQKLEWPEQFTKMLKSHTSRGSHHSSQHSLQRTSHLLSGGSSMELPMSSNSHPNGLLRHHSSSSSSDGMPTSGGSVELVNSRTSSPHLLSTPSTMLNSNGIPAAVVARPMPLVGSTTSSMLPTDLSFGAHSHHHLHTLHNGSTSGGVITTAVAVCPTPSPSASPKLVSATTTTTSSMVPKKRRRLSPTPSRLCGGEVSELPGNDLSVGSSGKGLFQDVDMTVRVSNCGTSGAKVTIRTNNGAISGGSVVAAPPPVDFTKMIEPPSPKISKAVPINGAIFFPGPGPSSPAPLSLVSTNSSKRLRETSLSPCRSSATPAETKPKNPRGRPSRKKSVPEVANAVAASSSSPSSLLRLAVPPEIPSRPKLSSSSHASSHSSSPVRSQQHQQQQLASMTKTAHSSVSPPTQTPPPPTKSENSNPVILNKSPVELSNKETPTSTPFTVVPTTTPQNPKRPTFLALKPVNTNSKKTEPGVLPSPETPRVAKPYNQMTINGQAYTYLGFKVSTRSSYTCLFKTQPMFIPQETDPKLSMYTNWQPRPRDPNQMEIGISTNDSRVNGRKSPHHILYTSAVGKGLDTLTVSSPDNQPPISSPLCENKTFLSGLPTTSSDSATLPINVQVSPPLTSASTAADTSFEPISPPSSASSASSSYSPTVSSYVVSSSSNPSGSGGLVMSMASSGSPRPIMTTSPSKSKPRKDTTGSDTSSAEESPGSRRRSSSTGFGRSGPDQDDMSNISSDGPLALTSRREAEQRVRIMEGGFESNEDYTYVRGRGRGRYVCEACGIRCKKPSMLRKHLKTHTDLRPYTCKLCNFSFKTKGNLTKHQKSKSHHKKCAGLGIHPESSTSLAMIGPGAMAISDTNTTDDNESDDDDDDNGEDEGTDSQEEVDGEEDSQVDVGSIVPTRTSGGGGGSESFEKEIAQSLLDLSKVAFNPRVASQGSASGHSSSDYESGDGNQSGSSKRPTYAFNAMLEDISSNSSGGSANGTEPATPNAAAAPMDLSVKPTAQQQLYEQSSKRIKLEHKNGLVRTSLVVMEAEKWEPPEDEEAMMGIASGGGGDSDTKCLNLTKVLNNSAFVATDDSNSGMMSASIQLPEVKREVMDYPEPVGFSTPRPLFAGTAHLRQRQRTESETSSCSSVGGGTSSASRSGRTPPLMPPQQHPSPSNSASGSVKLHQPWLSPSELKEKKVEPIEITPVTHSGIVASAPTGPLNAPPSIEIKAVSISPVPASGSNAAPNIFKVGGVLDEGSNGGGAEISVKEIVSSAAQPSASLLTDSPNSKFFTGFSAANLKPQAEFRQPSGPQALIKDEGKAECNVCGKTFARASQLTLHMNIHFIERPFRCDPCGVSFRTKGHLIKHRRSSSHDCKVYLTEAWGVANEENPRPFKCPDCKIAFRIHGHLAKHLRSKMHIMRMECLGKLPFGIYFEMEKSGVNLNEIDTTDCDMSLVSLQNVARKIYGDQWRDRLTAPVEEPPA